MVEQIDRICPEADGTGDLDVSEEPESIVPPLTQKDWEEMALNIISGSNNEIKVNDQQIEQYKCLDEEKIVNEQ